MKHIGHVCISLQGNSGTLILHYFNRILPAFTDKPFLQDTYRSTVTAENEGKTEEVWVKSIGLFEGGLENNYLQHLLIYNTEILSSIRTCTSQEP